MKKKWKCVCGRFNSIRYSECVICQRDRFGFLENEVKPNEIISQLQKLLPIIKEITCTG